MVLASNINLITTTTTLSPREDVYLINATAGSITLTLPNITCNGMHYLLKRTDLITTSVVTLQGTGGQLIDGLATASILPNSNFRVQSYGTAWYIVDNNSSVRSDSKVLFSSAFVQNNGSAFISFAKVTTAQLICAFYYPGSNSETISKVTAVLGRNAGVTVEGNISIRVLGGATIASASFNSLTSNAGPSVFTTTTIANQPTGPSVLEYVITFDNTSSNNAKVDIYSLTIQ